MFLVSPATQSIEAWGKTFSEAALIVAFCLWTSLRSSPMRLSILDCILICPTVFYLAIAASGHYQSDFFLALLPALLFLGFFAWIVTLNSQTTAKLNNLSIVICTSFTLVGIYYFCMPHGVGLLEEQLGINNKVIIYSPLIINKYGGFGHPNNLASFASAIALLSYIVSNDSPSKKARLGGALSVIICSFAVFDSGSKIGALGLICSSALYVLFSLPNLRIHHTKFLLIPIALGFALSAMDLRSVSLDSEPNRSILDRNVTITDSSIQTRLQMLSISYQIFEEKPFFGSGLDSFARNYFEKASEQGFTTTLRASHPHNVIADLASELGVFGLVIVLGSMALWVINHLRSRSSILVALASLPLALQLMTEFPQESSINHWALFGLIFVLSRRANGHSEKRLGIVSSNLTRSLVSSISLPCLAVSLYITGALYFVTKQNLIYEQIHPIKVIAQDALDPLATLPFVSHITARHVADKALALAVLQNNSRLAEIFLPRYTNTLNYWGVPASFKLEQDALKLISTEKIRTD